MLDGIKMSTQIYIIFYEIAFFVFSAGINCCEYQCLVCEIKLFCQGCKMKNIPAIVLRKPQL